MFQKEFDIDQLIEFKNNLEETKNDSFESSSQNNSNLDLYSKTSYINKSFQNKLYMSFLIESNSIYSHVKYFDTFLSKTQFQKMIFSLKMKYLDTSIIVFYRNGNKIFVNNLKKSIEFLSNWNLIKNQFDSIMNENTNVLKNLKDRHVEWWESRNLIDSKLGKFIENLKKEFLKCFPILKERIVLVMDENCHEIPFEAIFERKIIFRVPSLEYLENRISNNLSEKPINSSFYLLDPANNLDKTNARLTEYLNSRGIKNGVSGRPLTVQELEELENHNLFMYFGHGSGRKYFSINTSKPPAVFLFGCSSVKLLQIPNYRPNGAILRKYFNNDFDRIVVGNLWDVTDKDLDILTEKFLNQNLLKIKDQEKFILSKNFGGKMESLRSFCNMKYLNGAALVIYGMP